jgi:two-component system alkaline phosphatase synthesis response regulator PhoP
MENQGYDILIVDDEPDIVEFLSYSLKREGYNVQTANNGKDAISIAKSKIPHLILLDVMMPEMDGIETCERLREIQSWIKLSLLFLPHVAKITAR